MSEAATRTERFATAEFATAAALVEAARRVRKAGFREFDALTPCHVEALDAIVPGRPPRLRLAMLLGALAAGLSTLLLQWYSAVIDYPIDAGGRPLAAWPAFGFAVFEMAILGAAVAGFVALLVVTGLPALYHPLFEAPATMRVSDDRFVLVVSARDPLFDELDTILHDLDAQAVDMREVAL